MPDRTAASPEVVLITGASSGIGRATALELAGRGRPPGPRRPGRRRPSTTPPSEARAAGAADVLVRPADVTDEDAIRAAVDGHGGAVRPPRRRRPRRPGDGLRHDRGGAAGGLRDRRRDRGARHRRTSPGWSCPVFRGQGAGHLVIVNSLLGQVAAPLMGSYVAAKWGQLGLIRVLQQETRDVPGRHRLRHPARRGGHPDLLPGGVLDRQHRPAPAAGLLAAVGVARRIVCPPGPAAPAGAGGHLQPADHRRVPAGAGGLRPPGRAAAAAAGDRRRRGAADRGQRLRLPAGAATPPRARWRSI